MPANEIKCPGGEIVHPVLSLSGEAVQCRIQGGLRPARTQPDATGGTQPVVCCDQYVVCQIWRRHIDITRRSPSTKKQRDQTLAPLHSHT